MPSNNWVEQFKYGKEQNDYQSDMQGDTNPTIRPQQSFNESTGKYEDRGAKDTNWFDTAKYNVGKAIGNEEMIKKNAYAIEDGVVQSRNNKEFNDMDSNALQQMLVDAKGKEGDDHLYQIENVHTGEMKLGVAKNDVADRYRNDPSFRSNYRVVFDKPVSNANEIENKFHGSKIARTNQANPIGSSQSGLASGNTEIYGSDSMPTQILKSAYNQVNLDGLTDTQKLAGNMVLGVKDPFNISQKPMTEKELINDRDFGEKAYEYMKSTGQRTQGKTYKQMSEEMVEQLAGVNNNATKMAGLMIDREHQTPRQQQLYAEMMNSYDATPTTTKQFIRGVGEVAKDFTTYAGVGTFGVGTVASQSAKQIAKQGIKQSVKNTGMKSARNNAMIGAVEGGAYGTGFDAGKQVIEQGAESKDLNKTRLATSGILGGILGGALGGGITAVVNKFGEKSAMVRAMNKVEDSGSLSTAEKNNVRAGYESDIAKAKSELSLMEKGTKAYKDARKNLSEMVRGRKELTDTNIDKMVGEVSVGSSTKEVPTSNDSVVANKVDVETPVEAPKQDIGTNEKIAKSNLEKQETDVKKEESYKASKKSISDSLDNLDTNIGSNKETTRATVSPELRKELFDTYDGNQNVQALQSSRLSKQELEKQLRVAREKMKGLKGKEREDAKKDYINLKKELDEAMVADKETGKRLDDVNVGDDAPFYVTTQKTDSRGRDYSTQTMTAETKGNVNRSERSVKLDDNGNPMRVKDIINGKHGNKALKELLSDYSQILDFRKKYGTKVEGKGGEARYNSGMKEALPEQSKLDALTKELEVDNYKNREDWDKRKDVKITSEKDTLAIQSQLEKRMNLLQEDLDRDIAKAIKKSSLAGNENVSASELSKSVRGLDTQIQRNQDLKHLRDGIADIETVVKNESDRLKKESKARISDMKKMEDIKAEELNLYKELTDLGIEAKKPSFDKKIEKTKFVNKKGTKETPTEKAKRLDTTLEDEKALHTKLVRAKKNDIESIKNGTVPRYSKDAEYRLQSELKGNELDEFNQNGNIVNQYGTEIKVINDVNPKSKKGKELYGNAKDVAIRKEVLQYQKNREGKQKYDRNSEEWRDLMRVKNGDMTEQQFINKYLPEPELGKKEANLKIASKAKVAQEMNTQTNDALGINTDRNLESVALKSSFEEIDAKNSQKQVMSALLADKEMAKISNILRDDKSDVRKLVGDAISGKYNKELFSDKQNSDAKAIRDKMLVNSKAELERMRKEAKALKC